MSKLIMRHIQLGEEKQALALLPTVPVSTLNKVYTMGAEKGLCVLHLAAMAGMVDLTKALISKGVSVRAQDAKGRNAMHYALFQASDSPEILEALNNADYFLKDDIDDQGHSPLHYAANFGKPSQAKALVELGANASLVDHENNSAAALADTQGFSDIALMIRSAISLQERVMLAIKESEHYADALKSLPTSMAEDIVEFCHPEKRWLRQCHLQKAQRVAEADEDQVASLTADLAKVTI